MNLEEVINNHLKESIKSGDKIRTDTIRSLRAAIIEFNKSGVGRALSEEDGLKILQNAAKKRKDAIEIYSKANRPELLEREKIELQIISEFLPKQLSEDEIKEVILGIVKSSGATGPQDLGKVMGPAMKELRGKVDGNVVQSLVKAILGIN